MKLRQLHEDVTADDVYAALAKAEFERLEGKGPAGRFVSVDVIDGAPVDLEYVYNSDTGSWSFLAARSGEKRQEITSGRGEDDLIRHLNRKRRLSRWVLGTLDA